MHSIRDGRLIQEGEIILPLLLGKFSGLNKGYMKKLIIFD